MTAEQLLRVTSTKSEERSEDRTKRSKNNERRSNEAKQRSTSTSAHHTGRSWRGVGTGTGAAAPAARAAARRAPRSLLPIAAPCDLLHLRCASASGGPGALVASGLAWWSASIPRTSWRPTPSCHRYIGPPHRQHGSPSRSLALSARAALRCALVSRTELGITHHHTRSRQQQDYTRRGCEQPSHAHTWIWACGMAVTSW